LLAHVFTQSLTHIQTSWHNISQKWNRVIAPPTIIKMQFIFCNIYTWLYCWKFQHGKKCKPIGFLFQAKTKAPQCWLLTCCLRKCRVNLVFTMFSKQCLYNTHSSILEEACGHDDDVDILLPDQMPEGRQGFAPWSWNTQQCLRYQQNRTNETFLICSACFANSCWCCISWTLQHEMLIFTGNN